MSESSFQNAPADAAAGTQPPAPESGKPSATGRLVAFSEGIGEGTEIGDGTGISERTLGAGLLFNVIVPLGLLAVGGLVVLLLGSVEPEKRPDADTTWAGRLRALPPVRVAQLQSLAGQQLHLEVDGTVVPFREARVAAEVAGRVVYKSDQCEAGGYVTKGQLLMRIDPTDYELEVQRLTRLQEQEYQALLEIDQEMSNARRLIDVAKKDVTLQQKEVDRLSAMPEGFASPAEIDQANRGLLASTQQLVNVENQLDLLRKRRTRQEAAERLAATQLMSANVNLKRTEIRAPIEGVIVNEDADLNTFVGRGNMLVTIEDTSKVEVATNLRMDQLYWVLDQQAEQTESESRGYDLPETPAIIEYEMSGRRDFVYRWKGRLLSFDGIGLDPVTRTVPVRVVVDDPTDYVDANGKPQQVTRASALVRGMFVRIKLLIQPRTQMVVIPARALQPGNRVLQFVPDESVLSSATQQVSQRVEDTETKVPATTSSAVTDANQGESFDPSLWEPGRVLLRRSVNPVDALHVAAASTTRSSPLRPSDRMWVCESVDADLSAGSFVVVSPLSGIDQTRGLPVRAQRDGMQVDTSRCPPPTQPSTASHSHDSAAAASMPSGDAS